MRKFKGYKVPLPEKYPLWEPPEQKIAERILMGLVLGVAIPAMIVTGAGANILLKGAVKYLFHKLDFNREVKRLQKRGYVALTKTPDGWMVKLLKKGKKRLDQIEFNNIRLPYELKWDGKWRLLIFDIPEKEKIARDLLRQKLKDLGMFNFQRSTFAYPYDCRKELEFICDHYGLSPHTTYVETAFIDIDRELRRFFKVH